MNKEKANQRLCLTQRKKGNKKKTQKKKTQEVQQKKPYEIVSKNRIATNSGASVELITENRQLPAYNNRKWHTYIQY